MKQTISSMRLTGIDRNYYAHQLQEFADNIPVLLKRDDIVSVCFGKQDSRGALSITLFDDKHCVPMQKHFDSKAELLGYVCGVNKAISGDTYL